ncbi:H+-ATPase subunit E/Vma4 [Ruminococcaceae bacterium P7]|nr:H+-ATPase subunit E/Vma4 [Ruminococcaceae bacterium P7]
MPKNKTDNFLKAIRRYAKQQKSVMKGEVKQLKTERLKEAEEKAKRDSQRLIKDKLQETRTRQTAILAKKTQDGQRKLFIARSAMVEEVFKKAADKLVEYAKSDAYTSKLTDSAKAIADVFDGRDCVLYVNERDLGAAEGIKALFSGSTEVRADKTIKIGGIRGYCASMGIIADETLDSKLEAQREWFVENAALSVL